MTAKLQKFRVPYPPSANRYWRHTNGRIYRSSEASDYIGDVAFEAARQRVQCITGRVAVSLRIYRPLRSGDLDNRLKVLLDALSGIAYDDDADIVELHAYRLDDKHDPRVEIKIKPR